MKLTDARKLALTEMMRWSLYDWSFDFDKAVRRFGACHYNLKRITLSKTLVELNDEKQVRNVILHEIAHAIAGHSNGHNQAWKDCAKSIGCDGERCYSEEVVKPPKRFSGICPNCHHRIERNQRKGACAGCCKRYNHGFYSSKYEYKWTRN